MPSSDRTSEGSPGRRQRKKQETRERIVDGAAELFAADGYDSTTLEDISERADISRATLFNYFARKEDIVLDWFSRRRAEMAERLADTEEHPTEAAARLGRAFRALGLMYEDDPATGRAMLRAWLRAGGPLLDDTAESPALFAETVHEGQQRGDVDPEIDAELAGHVLFDAYVGVLFRWVRSDGTSFPLVGNLSTALDLVLAGITSPQEARPRRGRRRPQ